ncbi:DUF4126 domain-containing protein [Aestuariimicrobium kwangyangense]|uniref:DUF4126 domain-containing protein n=1 Tax=Aestuariimicrobium kwangyangense TaxID=396389 RepID=UPI0003B38AC9|nr:DUF4126 domain-containing protein [Aestuariimicrobium kwangyangense]
MELLPMTFASGWASGINAYATVLVLGLMGRFAHEPSVPAGFQRTDVLIVMTVLAVLELVADKIPYLDSAWDTVSTIIRPVAGAVIGALIAGHSGSLLTLSLAAVGGVSALLSHLTKAGLRLAINTSPEPVTNVAASAAGDVSVVGVAALAASFPVVAAIIAGVLLVATAIVFWFAFSRVRRGWRAIRRWLRPEPRPS